MERQQTLTIGFSLEILEEKIRTFEEKQRQWMDCIKEVGLIQLPQDLNCPLKVNVSDETQLINYRFQLMYNRIKRLMDIQSLMIQRLMIDSSSKTSQFALVGQTPRGENYELYQLLNDANKAVANLQSLNAYSKNKNKELEQQVRKLNLQLSQEKQNAKGKMEVLMEWQLKQKTWHVEKDHLLRNVEDLKRKVKEQQQNIDTHKSKIVRSDVEKENLLKEIEELQQSIKEERMKAEAVERNTRTRMQQMKVQLREELKSHVELLETHETASFKLLKKLLPRIRITN